MHILVAPDSFKDSMDCLLAAKSIERGIKGLDRKITVSLLPLSDGGEGFAKLLTRYKQGKTLSAVVRNPIGKPTKANYGWHEPSKTAYIDVASASGLELLRPSERNPMKTSSFGTGELINKAMERGATSVVVGLGGSATIDMGVGMAAALGFVFRDKQGKKIASPKGCDLLRIASVEPASLRSAWGDVRFVMACDVTNPLTGSTGAVRVYGEQKGASSTSMLALEKGMSSLAELVGRRRGLHFNRIPGSGAAGGLAAGGLAFLGAEIVSGADYLFEAINLDEHLKKADVVITGEGKVDSQFFHGKLLERLASKALRHQKILVALVGSVQLNRQERKRLPFDYVGSIASRPMSLEGAIANASAHLEASAYEVTRLLRAGFGRRQATPQ